MLSHRNLLAGSRIVIQYLEITDRDRILSILPFSFDYGLNQLLTAVQQRALTVLFTFQLGDEIVRAIRDHAITGLAGVPTIWVILTKTSPLLRKTKLPTLRNSAREQITMRAPESSTMWRICWARRHAVDRHERRPTPG